MLHLIKAASLSVGSGALPKLLDGLSLMVPIITAGLAGSGVLPKILMATKALCVWRKPWQIVATRLTLP
jgi:hypothetical protein